MRYAQSPRSKQQVLIIAFLGVCVFAAGLVVAPATAAAHHDTVDDVPRVGTYEDHRPDWTSSSWTKHGSNCGAWGCGDDFWVTTKKGAKAAWYLPNMQGVYTFGRTLGKHFRIDGINGYPATGTVKWTIWEWRKGSSSYRKVRTFTPNSQRDRLGWWTYNRTRIELDGAVKIIAEALESGERVGVQHVRLNHVDVLPELKKAAQEMCKAGVVKALLPTVAIPAALGAAVVVVYAAPLISAKVGGAAGAKLLAPKAAELLSLAIPGTAITAKDFVKGEIASWIIDRVRDFLSDVWQVLLEIWDDAIESYQYGCNQFEAGLEYLGITRGYGNYADDLAETYGRRR